jgi:adenylosuccinate synthase
MDLEKTGGLCSNIGSTGSGTGAVTVDKVLRQEGVLLKHQDEWLDKFGKYVGNTVEIVNWHLNRNHAILLEGTQGFGLCLNLSPYYPYVTSRDICASNLMAEAGIAPGFHAFTVGVLRTYPIRVAGNSGPTGSQSLTWDEITNRSGAGQAIIEHTSYTNKVRRVFEPDWDILKRAVQVNRPSFLAMTFADYLSHRDYGKREFEDLSPVSGEFVEQVESELGVPVGLIGTGPGEEDIIERRHVTSRYFELLPNA